MRGEQRHRAEIVIIGSGPGSAITGAMLSEAGRDVLVLENGPDLRLDAAPHFSLEEIASKYRSGGITVGMGKANVSYVEGRCVGGGSEINRGMYHRASAQLLDAWVKEFRVQGLADNGLAAHYEACEAGAPVSKVLGSPSPTSLKLHEGAINLGWKSSEVPRLARYVVDGRGVTRSIKSSMTETFVPRFVAAGGRLLPNTWVQRLSRSNGSWQIRAENLEKRLSMEIAADTVFVSGGAIQTPALLRRSGFTGRVGDTLRFHPMVKVVARFADEINLPGMTDPVHQVKEFDPLFSLGCSISTRPTLALTMVDHPEHLAEVDRDARHLALYYAQTTGGRGRVRSLPGFRDPFVRAEVAYEELRDLALATYRLCECLFAAGAVALYPGISGYPVLRSMADLKRLPAILPADRANLSTLHLFATCPMGEDRNRCITNSFGKVYGAENLYIADASLLCGPTVVNPQGTVMAVAHRNVLEFLNHTALSRPKH